MKKNIWTPVENFPELWVGQYVVPNFMSNSIALKVNNDEWVLVSPGRGLLSDWISRFGSDCRLSIIMPNAFHYMGVADWQGHFPQAKLYASKKAIPRLRKQGINDVFALETESPNLPQDYVIDFPPGHRGGDVWLCKRGAVGAWITCDSFLNYERMSNQPIARAMQKLLGAAPGLKMSQVVKWLILDQRRSFKEWVLGRLEAHPPGLLIPSHGEPSQSCHLADDLKALIEERL